MAPRSLTQVLILGALLCCVLPVGVFAQDRPDRALVLEGEGSLKRALLIGNDEYLHVPSLKNAKNDVVALGKVLENLEFQVEVVKDANLEEMEKAIDRFISDLRLRPGGIGLVHYSGHGTEVNQQNYLIPIDFKLRDEASIKYEAYAASKLVDRMVEARTALSIVILDACRNNGLRSQQRASLSGLARMIPAEGTLIAFAAAPGQTADDNPEGQNGLFTHHLLQALEKPGLDIQELFTEAREGVYRGSNRTQRPWVEANIIGKFYFRPGVVSSTGVPSAASEELMKVLQSNTEYLMWNSVKDSSEPEALETYVSTYPEGTFAEQAKKRIAELRKAKELETSAIILEGEFRIAPEILLDRQLLSLASLSYPRNRIEIPKVPVGQHTIRIEQPGFEDWGYSFETKALEPTTLSVTFSPISSRILVATRPIGARVVIKAKGAVVADGVSDAKGEFSATLGPGEYETEVSAEGYKAEVQTLEIEPGSPKTLSAILEPATGMILLTGAFPSRPEILLDSAPLDERNVTYTSSSVEIREVPAGKHFVRVTLPGYQGWQETVEVKPGRPREVTVALQVAPAVSVPVLFATRPLGARIVIRAGSAIVMEGASDTKGEFSTTLEPGEYQVAVSADDHMTAVRTLTVESGAPKTLSAILEPATGTIVLTGTFDPRPEILIDSAPLDARNVTFSSDRVEIREVAAGKHFLRLTQTGFDGWQETVDVEAGTPRVVPVALRRTPPVAAPVLVATRPFGSQVVIRSGAETVKEGVSDSNGEFSAVLAPGEYEVEMRAEGYQTQKRSLRIDSGSAKTLSAILEPATGTILLTGAFESRPEILLDSAPPDERNVTFHSDRIEIREVTAGRHFMRLTLPGSQGWQETVDIEAGKPKAIPVSLRPAPQVAATVLVATRPLGARVVIRSGAGIVTDGNSDERGEFSAVLGPGTYEARVSAEGYQSIERTLRIDSASPKTLSAILEPAMGSILLTGSFDSEPQILLDNELVSLTGVNFPAGKIEIPASVGQRSLLVVQAGFEDWRRDVDVRPGETTAVAATPQAKPSVLRVKSVPGAEVFIGDARKATVPDLGMIEITGLPPGPYDLRIVKDKYFESTLPVNLRPGRASAIEADLVRRFSGAFADSFDDLSNWLAPVSWQAEAGRLHVKGPGTGLIRDREYRDFTLEFDLRFAEGGDASWILRAESDRDYFLFRLQEPRGARRGRFIVEFYRDGRKARQTSQAVPIEFGDEWYHVKVEAKGARIEHSISSRLNPVPARVHVLDSGTFGMMYNYGAIGFGTQGAEEFAVSGFSVHPVEN